VRDIEDAFKDERLAIAVQDGGVGTWGAAVGYQAFARRDPSECEILYPSVDSAPLSALAIGQVHRVRTPTVGCYQKRTRSAALLRTAITLPSRVSPIRPLCPDHSPDQRWGTTNKIHARVVDFRNGQEIYTIIQMLTPSATYRVIRRHPGSERRAVHSMAHRYPLAVDQPCAIGSLNQARASCPASTSFGRRVSDDTAIDPPAHPALIDVRAVSGGSRMGRDRQAAALTTTSAARWRTRSRSVPRGVQLWITG
jgi:hypothetical protein